MAIETKSVKFAREIRREPVRSAVSAGHGEPRGLEALAIRMAASMERWFPETFVIVLLAVIVVALAALAIGVTPRAIVQSFGNGMWNLLPFSMQMALIVVTGYALATAGPVRRLIDALAGLPRSGRGAVTFVALMACR